MKDVILKTQPATELIDRYTLEGEPLQFTCLFGTVPTNLFGIAPPTIEKQIVLNDELLLLSRISKLEKEIKEIKYKRVLTTEESLVKLWDNEYDDQWDNY